jgi:ketosteroid isomerase-like protein
LEELFEHFAAKLAVIIVEIRLNGDVAYGYGWHDLTLVPRDGRPPVHRRERYMDVWRKNKEGSWKLWMYMDNQDVADPFWPGKIPTEQHETTGAS